MTVDSHIKRYRFEKACSFACYAAVLVFALTYISIKVFLWLPVFLAALWVLVAPVALFAAPFSIGWGLTAIGLGHKLMGISALLAGFVAPILLVLGVIGMFMAMSVP